MKNEALVKRIALCRIKMLFELARKRTLENTEESGRLAKRYLSISKRISTHYKVRIPKELKSKMCKKCGLFLIPGVNCKVRIASVHGYAAYICSCGSENHIHYKPRAE